MRICHTGDFHLGPSGTKLDSQTGLNARFLDRGRCAAFAVGDSITRGAELVLIAGDIFDGCRPTPTQVRCAREIFRPAAVRGIPVVAIKGNHDDVRNLAECHALDLLQELPGLMVVDRPCLLNVWVTREGGTVTVWPPEAVNLVGGDGPIPSSDIACQLACIPWPNKALLLADEENRRLSPTDLNLLVREKMMAVARGLADQRIEGLPCVLLIHCAFDTAEAGKQNTLAMLSSEWTLNIHEVASLGFDPVCAGHYHRRQVLNEEPWVGYCGSPEACSFAEETDGDKGYYLHTLGAEPEFVSSPFRRLLTLDYAADFAQAEELFSQGEFAGAIVRLRIPQAMADRQREFVQALEAAGAFEIRTEVIRSETTRRRETEITAGMRPDQALDEWLKGKSDLLPLRDQLHEEAARVDEGMGNG